MSEQDRLQEYATTIFEERKRRNALFPADLFDEYAWEILLCIFARNQPMNQRDAIGEVGCNPAVGRRWIDYLVEKKQVTRSDHLVEITGEARAAITAYLSESLERASNVAHHNEGAA